MRLSQPGHRSRPSRPRRRLSHPHWGRRSLGWLLVLLIVSIPVALVSCTRMTVPAAQALSAGTELLSKRKVLAIVGHPDDLEWYIGGTLRRLSDAGADVQVVVANNGDKGPNRTKVADLPATRQGEQLAAAKINGYTRVRFLGLPDRGSANDPRFLPAIRAIYQEVQPDAVFVFDPELPSLPYLHVDHQGTARVVLDYWRTLGQPAGTAPGTEVGAVTGANTGRPPVYLFQTRRPDVAVDISTVIGTKEKALAQHVTQNGGNGSGMRQMFGGKTVGVGYSEYFRRLN
jgi:LmbE family N-acetylglucosaminyl deacetylase